MNPLPPQAYTKETMLKAYAWVMNQPASIKELATTPDILVSLYLKAQRDGLDSLERPSIQNFRDELKSLAGMMSHLSSDGAQQSLSTQSFQTTTVSSVSTARTTSVAPQPQTTVVQPHSRPASQETVTIDPLFTAATTASPTAQQQTAFPAPSARQPEAPVSPKEEKNFIDLDERSLSLIREVKGKLNLSSENEALKALLQIGYNTLKNCLPQENSK